MNLGELDKASAGTSDVILRSDSLFLVPSADDEDARLFCREGIRDGETEVVRTDAHDDNWSIVNHITSRPFPHSPLRAAYSSIPRSGASSARRPRELGCVDRSREWAWNLLRPSSPVFSECEPSLERLWANELLGDRVSGGRQGYSDQTRDGCQHARLTARTVVLHVCSPVLTEIQKSESRLKTRRDETTRLDRDAFHENLSVFVLLRNTGEMPTVMAVMSREEAGAGWERSMT